MSAFRTTGVYPFNGEAVSVTDKCPQKFNPKSLPVSTGLAYIPLYSPAGKHSTAHTSRSDSVTSGDLLGDIVCSDALHTELEECSVPVFWKMSTKNLRHS